MANLNFPGKIGGPHTLTTVAQDLTANWVDLGAELHVAGARFIGLWVNLDINLSNNARIRLIAKHVDAGTDEYVLSIHTIGASDVKVEDEYIEFNVDADQKALLVWDLDGVVPYVQFQVQAGTVGGTAGQIDSSYVTTGV